MKKIFTLAIMLTATLSYAQWNSNYAVNTQITNVKSDVSMSKTTSDGKTFIVYWEDKAAPEYFQLRVQLLDQNGNKTFGDNGINVRSGITMSSYTVVNSISIDTQNNLYVGFSETLGDRNGYVNKISSTGQQVWGNEGINLGAFAADVKIFPSPDANSVYITYFQNNVGNINKYNATNASELWPAAKTIATPNVNYTATSVGEGQILSDGSFLALIHARATPAQPDSNFFAQRYSSADGTAMWANYTKLSNKGTFFNGRYSTLKEGDVIYLGYKAANGSRQDSYLQKLNADGTLPWNINGVDFSTTNSYFEKDTSIAMESGSGNIMSLVSASSSGQGAQGTYIQKFDKQTGARLLGDGAKEVFPIGTTSKVPSDHMLNIDNKFVFMTNNADSNGANPVTLSIAILDDNGNLTLPNGYVDISTSPNSKGRYNLTKYGTEVIGVWTEQRNESNVFAQNFDVSNYLAVASQSKSVDLNIYPNPVQNFLKIKSADKVNLVQVYNMTGHLVTSTFTSEIDFSKYPKGAYTLKINLQNGKIISKKVIKN